MITEEVRQFYVSHSPTSDPGPLGSLLDDLPTTINGLVDATGGLLMHVQTAHGLFGEPEPLDFGAGELTMSRMLENLITLYRAPLSLVRPPEKRLRVNCGRFAIFFLSALRQLGIPARKRVGFAWSGWIHEIVEYWDDARERWVLIDPDPSVRDALRDYVARVRGENPGEDNADLIRSGEAFWPGALAWRECRAGVDPGRFHVLDRDALHGVRIALLQDLDSLNKTELRTHDEWHRLMTVPMSELAEDDCRWLDKAADLVDSGDAGFDALRAHYERSAYGVTVRGRLGRMLINS